MHHSLDVIHLLCNILEIQDLFCIHHNFCDGDFDDNIIQILDHFYRLHNSYV